MSLSGLTPNYGFPDVELDSDDSFDDNESSEDEIDIILHGTPEQRRKLKHLFDKQTKSENVPRAVRDRPESSSEDEFEKEMDAELNKQVSFLENARGHSTASSSKLQNKAKGKEGTSASITKTKREEDFYDEIYFDSDEEDEDGNVSTPRKSKHAVISNDDLLYDPNMDDEDQNWVDQQRSSHRVLPQSKGQGKSKKAKMPNSDALLDCPACMTTLCIDCQRHETYKNQYRAMFVMNCEVDRSETLLCPEQETKRGKKKKKKLQETENKDPLGGSCNTDLFNPVRCTECRTVVGVIDKEEIYHFFNVLASYT